VAEKEKPLKSRFFTVPKIFAVLAALFISIGSYLSLKHVVPPLPATLFLIGLIFTIIFFRSHSSN